MLLSKKAIQEIYEVARVIHDIRGVSRGNELVIQKDAIEELPHGSSILHKLAEQYEVIDLVNIPYNPENDMQIYRGLNAQEVAVRQGADPTDPQVISFINAATLSYALITEPIFEDFMILLEKGLDGKGALSDKDLTPQPRHRIAELSFTSISVPTVTLHGEAHHYAPMQSTSMAYKIIRYCLDHHPNSEVSINMLLSGMKESAGLKNINEAIRKSPLFSEGGPLDFFITSSAKAITVTPRLTLTQKGVGQVILNSTEHHRYMENAIKARHDSA